MTTNPQKIALSDPSLFISPAMKVDVTEIRERSFRWMDKQPIWPQKKISFTTTDRTNRRKLIEALLETGSSGELLSIGHQILVCSRSKTCGSPLCNYCRTRFQDLYQERVLRYFGNTHRDDLVWLTLLDDLSYDPLSEVPERLKKLRVSFRAFLKRHYDKDIRAFGALEIDVKRPDLASDDDAGDLLREYGLRDEPGQAYMPHLHAIVALDGISARDFGKKLRTRYTKTKQVTVSSLRSNKTKNENLATLSRYCFKFRYQFADNILRDRPSYGSRFDDETLREYTQLVHSIGGQRGARGFEFLCNLSS